MSARDRILAKLKAANAAPAALPDVAGWYATHRVQEDAVAKTKRFRQCIELAHAETYAVSRGGWLQKLWEVLSAKQIGNLLVAPGTAHGARAQAELPALGIACPAYDQPIENWKEAMFRDTPAAFTSARAAIAETGTLILWPDANEPRLMSLVPPVHIVLLDTAHIYNTFYEAMRQEGWASGLPTNALLISGPSKTADIQQTLAYGAHGPKELVVLLIGDEQ
ncbi:LutC/YkgG family protein [Dechloromonas sp. A34]|uniref:LutC/YkgG family protein n=1 Tax=Dechloromonas sp. A34 TaxID=447588 RepID=UPI002249502F|nr:lactate utilization protein [Dechloromonas sp. A34]